ncbi:MAG TPA: Lrp/AsnC family transcriptional regulator [Candidatus Tumulicola sp.]|jgi:Lrp/AsnC family leucine-responsive transcriptional regulator
MLRSAAENAATDEIDRDILAALERDGRTSYIDLAREIGLSSNATADRVRRLLTLGVISGVRAELSPEALGLAVSAFIDVKLRSERAAEDFERALSELQGVVACTLTTGSFDYTLRVACRDREDLVRIAEYLRTQAGAAETYTRIVLRERRFGLIRPFTPAKRR